MLGIGKTEKRRGKAEVNRDSFVKRVCDLLTGKSKPRTTDPAPPPPDSEKKEKIPAPETEERLRWPPERVELVERIWGEGFVIPGGAEYVLEFVQLLSLDEKKSIQCFGNGLGGPGRSMASEYGAWIDGLEEDKELAELGSEQSRMAGMTKKAPVKRFNPEKFRAKKNGFNSVVGFEAFYTVADKEALFTKIADSIRVDGIFLFTDFVSAKDEPSGGSLRNWLQNEPMEPHLWTPQKTRAFLNTLLFETRIVEDITAQYKKRVLKGWFDFVNTLTKTELTVSFVATVIRECEYWIDRINALDSGELRIYRFEAVKLPKARAQIIT